MAPVHSITFALVAMMATLSVAIAVDAHNHALGVTEDSIFRSSEGFYLKAFNSTSFGEAYDFANSINAFLPVSIVNPSDVGMCLQGSSNDLRDGAPTKHINVPLTYNANVTNSVYIPPNSSLQIGDYVPQGDFVRYNGRFQVHIGCNEECTICPGTEIARHSLYEWGMVNDSTDPGEQGYWSNLSNVDGLTHNVNSTVYGADGNICGQSRGCSVTAKDMKTTCPADRLWEEGGASGCESDCKATGTDEHCCTGIYRDRSPECPQSSAFLKQLCPRAYSYPHDDKGQMDRCSNTDTSHIRVEFTPIV